MTENKVPNPDNGAAKPRRAELVLAEELTQLRLTLDHIPVGIFQIDGDLNITFVNDRYREMFGFPEGVAEVGSSIIGIYREMAERGDLGSSDVEDLVKEALTEYTSGKPAQYERYLSTGTILELERTPTPDGGALVVVTDITERKRAEEALREQSTLLRNVLDNARQGIVMYDAELRLMAWNWRFQEYLDLPDRLMRPGQPMPELTRYLAKRGHFGEGDPELLARQRVSFLSRGEATRTEIGIGDETYDVRSQPTPENGLVITYTDVTERKHAEEAFRNIFESAPIPMVLTRGRKGETILMNQRAADLLKISKEEAIGRSTVNYFVEPQQQEYLMETIKKVGRIEDFEIAFKRETGEEFWALLSGKPVQYNDETCLLAGWYDITERKRVTEEILQQKDAQLLQAQKMEAVGQLTGGIAHDFNNLMTVVQGNLELMREDLDESSDADTIELMDDALSAARDGSELAHRLLAFSRKQSLNPTRIDTNQLIGEFSRLVRRTVGQDIVLEIEIGEGVAAVHADRSQLENALLNLCVNSSHALPEGGTLSLETTNRRIGHSGAADFPEVGPGDYVMITVSDTGTGMPPEILAQIFEPFFTTKEAGKGSGLGLSMVYGFANQSGGGIKVESEVGKGTDISILLPVAPADATVQEESDEGGDLPRGPETVLVVEDEPRIRRFAARCLKDLGYQVLEAENATEALEVLKREPSVDLLFSDIVMPGGITGRELARTVSEAYPDVKVQLATGFSKGAAGENGEDDKRFPVLKKPYSKGQIARRIREVLDADK